MSVARHNTDAASIVALRTQVRDQIGDTSTVEANQRWPNTKIDQALANQMKWMYARLSIQPETAATAETINYDVGLDATLLPPQARANPILKVEDITDASNIIVMHRVDFFNIEDKGTNTYNGVTQRAHYVWCLVNDSLMIRPRPDASKVYRIWSLANPYTHVLRYDSNGDPVVANSTQAHPYSAMFEEFIVLGAAKRLLRVDEETPVQLIADYEELKDDFIKFSQRYRGPNMVHSRRTWR